MKNLHHSLTCFLLAAALSGSQLYAQSSNPLSDAGKKLVKVDPSQISPATSALLNFYDKQIYFTENKGQWPDNVLFRADFPLGQAVATENGMLVGTFDAKAVHDYEAQDTRREKAQHDGVKFGEDIVKVPAQGWLMNFVNHNPLTPSMGNQRGYMSIEGKTKHTDYYNYFIGNDPSKYASSVNNYQEIWYRNVYDNVDVRYYPSQEGPLEYDIVCNPGFDKDKIAIQLDGISQMNLKDNGHLVLKTSVGDMEFPAPVAYQRINGAEVSVKAKYILTNNTLTFELGTYDETQPLIIDPIALRWATWMTNNSGGANHGHAIWVDQSDGSIYVVGRIPSTNLITVNAIQNVYAGGGNENNEIGKYTEPVNVGGAGTRVWQTYLGGAATSNPYAMEQAANGDIIFTGILTGAGYPMGGGNQYAGTGNPINDSAQSYNTIFITKINKAGTSFKSCIVGGNGDQESFDLRTTPNSQILVCGYTTSTNLATLFPGSGATNVNNGGEDVLVFKITNSLDTMIWMRNYGGTGNDQANIMVSNPNNGDIFVAGYTTSTNFPTASPRQAGLVGTEDGFIQKLNSSGNTVWSSYYNAAAKNTASILCMEFNTTQTSVYFGGVTTALAAANISTKNVIQTAIKGGDDFFVTKMDTNQHFDEATYLGGSANDTNMMGLNTDLNNDVYVFGYTLSTDFPVTAATALQPKNLGQDDGTFTKIRTDLDSLEYSTYYGGSGDDYDPVGERGIKFYNCHIYTIATSGSTDLPLTTGAITTNKLSGNQYEPSIQVWANPPDLLNNTLGGNQQICNGVVPASLTGSVPAYSLDSISRNNVNTPYPVTLNSATTYQWQESTDSINWTNIPGATKQNLSDTLIGVLKQTTYFRRIIGGDACVIAGPAAQVVTVKTFAVTSTVTNIACYGGSGSITANPAGTSPYTYSWSTGATTQTISNVSTGTYTVVVKDATGCIDTAKFSITQPSSAISATTSSGSSSCTGNTGSASVTVTGGVSPYSYSWSNGGTTSTISNISGGNYTVTVKDANSCSHTASVTVGSSSAMTATATVSGNESCNGGKTGVAVASATGGTTPYTYSWSNGKATATITALTAGSYTITIKDKNGCTATASVAVTQPLAISVKDSVTSNIACGGTGSAYSTVSGGTTPYTYKWSSSATTSSVTGLSAGSYTTTVTDTHGCTGTATVSITQGAALTPSVTVTANDKCNGGNTGAASVSVSGGKTPYTYSWSNGTTLSSVKNLTAGTYTVTIKDAGGCSSTATAVITQPAAITISTTIVNGTCKVNGSASATASGGSTPYTYKWSNSGTTSSISNLSAGTYSVTVTDANSCAAAASVTITQASGSAVSSFCNQVQNIKCNGQTNGVVNIVDTGGASPYTYSWSNGATTSTLSNLSAGTYTVVITDANGCTSTSSIDVTQPNVLTITTSSVNSGCKGNGSATATVSGGTKSYTYSWSNGATTSSITNISAGSFTVMVTDSNSCTASSTVSVNNSAVSLNTNCDCTRGESCYGGDNGTTGAVANGGTPPYTYSWNNGATTSSIGNLTAGSYTITVTDASGCTASASTVVTQPTALTVTTTVVNAGCSGYGSATANPGGGTSPYTYSWSNGATTSSVSSLTTGSYTITLKDNSGCTATSSFAITKSASMTVSTTTTGATCGGGNNGTAKATVVGGTSPYTYSWNNGQTSSTASGLSGGTYTITVTDKNGCTATASAVITQGAAITVSISSTNATCSAKGTAIAVVSGGSSPYTYSWSTGGTTSSITGLSAGSYTLTAKDKNGCSATASVAITQSAGLSIRDSLINASCKGNGSATAYVSGGSTPYTYSWSTGATTSSVSQLTGGSYTVTAKDKNGCSATAVVSISKSTPPTVTTTVNANDLCNGGATGSAAANVSGGSSPYTYSWTNGSKTSSASGLSAGSYTVTVTDINGCTATAKASITQPAAVSGTSTTKGVSCNGGNNGSATISGTGGTSPYTYSWSTGPTTTNITGMPGGTYTVTVKDKNGCTGTVAVNITEPSGIGLTTSHVNDSSHNGANGSANVTASGGTPAYTYTWSNKGTTSSITGLTAGSYTVTVTDKNGCTATASLTITQPAMPNAPGRGGDRNSGYFDNVNLYPNPTTGEFHIDGVEQGAIMQIYDYSGRMIRSAIADNSSAMIINLSDQPNGLYLVRIISKEGILVEQKKVDKIR